MGRTDGIDLFFILAVVIHGSIAVRVTFRQFNGARLVILARAKIRTKPAKGFLFVGKALALNPEVVSHFGAQRFYQRL